MVPRRSSVRSVVLVIVSVDGYRCDHDGAYQARRTVWEQEIRDSERSPSIRGDGWSRSSARPAHPLAGSAVSEAIADGVVPDDEVRVHAKTLTGIDSPFRDGG